MAELNRADVVKHIDDLTLMLAKWREEIISEEDSVEVPGQSLWRPSMIEQLRPIIMHLKGVVALLDATSENPETAVTYQQVLSRSGLSDTQQRNEHARLTRISLELFGVRTWPIEAWQDASDGVMRYRASGLVAKWWQKRMGT